MNEMKCISFGFPGVGLDLLYSLIQDTHSVLYDRNNRWTKPLG